ncbi:ABC transporter ATP-binding protein [Virgisporangium aliadipatigenens]|uniref:ABC transporter ATP-binding protein n=1 Tax=Virgisporangium aliadipatigenens TaxID=741659 RepID=A0A8J4DSZ2_9ACTN|nr:ATP-binding cassette domain-containing protein [Virgisporangium aliadipatigenens]GIJ47727.1 ABC transporter ATP-binding protein [Virgisporangium aliadipatigenens]
MAEAALREGGDRSVPALGASSHRSDDAVATYGLTKRFGHQVAVDSVELRVPRGAVYGFLGPNGSGKTTTIRMLLGLIMPTAGRHDLLGEPFQEKAGAILPRVGALCEGPAFHPYLSGRANLARLDAADRTADPRTVKRRIDAALERVGLTAAAGKRYRAYSLGMRQRLAIAAALLTPRDLLILDEPTNGLDPQGTREVRALVSGLAAEGATVMLSTHLLSEVEQICTHVGVMHQGKLVTQGSLAQLRARAQRRVRVETERPEAAAETLTALGLAEVTTGPGTAEGLLGELAPEKIVATLVHDDVPVRGFGVVAPDLEDMFVELTGEGFDVSA